MYYLLTRQEWWSYWRHRKAFFWFSPSPVPVGWWEYFYIVILTTFLSFGLAKIDPWMISKWEVGRGKLRKCFFPGGAKREGLTTIQTILQEVERLTGAEVEPDWTLAECGLSSVAGPVIINMLSNAVPGVTLSLADLVEVDTIGGLANLLESRKKEMNATGLGTTAPPAAATTKTPCSASLLPQATSSSPRRRLAQMSFVIELPQLASPHTPSPVGWLPT